MFLTSDCNLVIEYIYNSPYHSRGLKRQSLVEVLTLMILRHHSAIIPSEFSKHIVSGSDWKHVVLPIVRGLVDFHRTRNYYVKSSLNSGYRQRHDHIHTCDEIEKSVALKWSVCLSPKTLVPVEILTLVHLEERFNPHRNIIYRLNKRWIKQFLPLEHEIISNYFSNNFQITVRPTRISFIFPVMSFTFQNLL